jgi:nucleotide-binding universal stress UspA family protein
LSFSFLNTNYKIQNTKHKTQNTKPGTGLALGSTERERERDNLRGIEINKEPMERLRVVVVVEEAEASRAALQWAVHNYIRCQDSITLLHVCPFVRSRSKRRNLRLRGFQLALSFKDLCNGIAEAKVEIVVTEGEHGDSIISTVNKTGATTLLLGLHDASFLYRYVMLCYVMLCMYIIRF